MMVDDPTITRALREEIKRCIDEIQPQLRKKVMKNLDERVRICQQNVEAISLKK